MRVGSTITLKPENMSAGSNKLSLTKTQLSHFNKALATVKGAQFNFLKAAIFDMIKSGGFLSFLIPAIAALATGALSGAAGWGTKKLRDKATGGAIGRKKGDRIKVTRKQIHPDVSSVIENSKNFIPISNFDLAGAVKSLPVKHFRGVFMKDQLPARPKIPETRIINLDDHTGPGTHWTCYGISPSSIIYFDLYLSNMCLNSAGFSSASFSSVKNQRFQFGIQRCQHKR